MLKKLNKFISTHNSMVPTPTGKECPSNTGKANVSDEPVEELDLEIDTSDASMVKYAMNSLTIVISLFALYFM